MFQNYLTELLVSKCGFEVCTLLPTLLRSDSAQVVMAIHVDDPLASRASENHVHRVFDTLAGWIATKVGQPMGSDVPTTYLGGRYWRTADTIIEAPSEGYMESMVEIAGVRNGKTVVTPSVAPNAKGRGGHGGRQGRPPRVSTLCGQGPVRV